MNDAGARFLYPVLLALTTSAAPLCGQVVAFAGPCTEQITQLEQRVATSTPGPQSGPTDAQSVGAQLHHQPTPGSVVLAEQAADEDGVAAIDHAKRADAAGDAASCNQAVAEARRVCAITR
jgi:hypothetical protein